MAEQANLNGENRPSGASASHNRLLRSSIGVAGATLLSRILGLVRVRFESLTLGGGDIASGWFLAFAFPNLFRRLLGEGALGTALIPMIAQTDAKSGTDELRKDLGMIFFVLSLILALIVIIFSGGSLLLANLSSTTNIGFFATPRMQIFLQLLPILMPYAFFICLTGVVGAVLNYARVFFLPALGALILNIVLISMMAIGYFQFNASPERINEFLPFLAYSVLVSGAVQLILMLFLLKRHGHLPRFSWQIFRERKNVVKELFQLALPGMIGGAALQVSFIIDRLIAAWLGKQAVPALTYVDRLVDLPIGIFALSLGTVLMSSMARNAASGDRNGFSDALTFGLRHVYFVCLPMASAMLFFHQEMLTLLCMGGNYTAEDLEATRTVAIFYGAGIPFFCSLKVILPAFYARKKTMQPLYVSLITIILNIILNFSLMWHLQQGGIALATTISSLFHNIILLVLLQKEGIKVAWMDMIFPFVRAMTIAFVCGGLCRFFYNRYWEIPTGLWSGELSRFLIIMVFFGASYWTLSSLSGSDEPGEFLAMMKQRSIDRRSS